MVVFYVTAHGYGHAARSLEVMRALLARGCPVTVVTDVVSEFFSRDPHLGLRKGGFDCGLIQRDSVRGDISATLTACQELMSQSAQLQRQEEQFLGEIGARLVVVDAPALPLSAAAAVGVPAVGLTSFGWDYIYQPFVERDRRWQRICDEFRRHYAMATLWLQYPMAAPLDYGAPREAVPLVSRPGSPQRSLIAEQTGARLDRPWVLVWFHELALHSDSLKDLPFEFFPRGSLCWSGPNFHRPAVDFPDLLASVDVVVSKPGFGIISDCVANRKPLVYVPRTDFCEAQLLETAIVRYLPHARIESEELYAGRWAPALQRALEAPFPAEGLPCQGAEAIAQRLLQVAGVCRSAPEPGQTIPG